MNSFSGGTYCMFNGKMLHFSYWVETEVQHRQERSLLSVELVSFERCYLCSCF